MRTAARNLLILMVVFAVMGAVFAGISTADFVAHLDRQMHSVACSFIPGVGTRDTAGTSGCFAVMMSPYSSVFRTAIWGGIPIALAGMAVYAYLAFMGLDFVVRRRWQVRADLWYALAASALPVITSIVYFYISYAVIHSVCKICIMMYLASFGGFISALLALLLSGRREEAAPTAVKPGNTVLNWALYFGEGVVFVAAAMVLYLAVKPVYSEDMTNCGSSIRPEDKYGVIFPLKAREGGVPVLEVVDPLCPACRVLKERLDGSPLEQQMDIKAIVFPLDKECNWMVQQSLHPGACAVSEALLCAGDKVESVLDWALLNNERIRTMAKSSGSTAVYTEIVSQFPELAACVNKPEVKSRINKSLRWIVSNSLSVLTPQLFIAGKKLCDEDTDLGLDYSLTRLMNEARTAAASTTPTAPAPTPAGN